jgi:large subunit ribosomal protein L3
MKFILGTKLNMTQLFADDGKVAPVTAIKVDANTIAKIKTVESDGYNAVVLGYGDQKVERVAKSLVTSFGGKAYKAIKEFRTDGAPTQIAGDTVDVSAFVKGETVTVTGISKSKGFQGVVKRHGFAGGPRTHGQKHSEREPGSIGGGLRTRVPKGMRMAGRMGGDTVTVKGLKVVAVDPTESTIYISGAVPGRRGTLVSIVA